MSCNKCRNSRLTNVKRSLLTTVKTILFIKIFNLRAYVFKNDEVLFFFESRDMTLPFIREVKVAYCVYRMTCLYQPQFQFVLFQFSCKSKKCLKFLSGALSSTHVSAQDFRQLIAISVGLHICLCFWMSVLFCLAMSVFIIGVYPPRCAWLL